MSFFTNRNIKAKKNQEKRKNVNYEGTRLQDVFAREYFNANKSDDAYHVQNLFEYNCEIDSKKLFLAWKQAKKRFSTLRSRFSWDKKLIQIIDKYNESIEFCKLFDLTHLSKENEQDIEIKNIQIEDRLNLYKLDEGNLLRIFLFKKNKFKYVCLFSHHHSILDGWSIDILLNYVNDTYLNLINDDLLESANQEDNDFKNVQNYLQSNLNTDYDYWNSKLEQIEEKNDLRVFLSNNNNENIINNNKYRNVKNEILKISNEKYENLKFLLSKYGITANALFQFIWHKILNTYSNTKQTVIGTTISGRNIPINNVENTVGCFINTLPLIVNHTDEINTNIIDKIKEIQDSINELNIHSNVKLSKLQKNAQSLFDILFVFENYPEIKNDRLNQLGINILDSTNIEKNMIDLPINIIIYDYKKTQTISVEINYASDLFDSILIKDLLTLFHNLLLQIIHDPNEKISNLDFLIPYHREKIFNEWNNTEKYYPEDKLINEIFEETVNKYPDNIAVVYEDIKLTYKELNERANRLSNYLINNYIIKPDDLIALCVDRSELMIITILAVWKSGAAYVPMDPNFPENRMEYILNDTKTTIILSNDIYLEKLKSLNLSEKMNIVSIDDTKLNEKLNEYSNSNVKSDAKSNNLAYIIYTSGTTGNPKGVMIEHKSVISYKYSIFNLYCKNSLTHDQTILFISNYVFDMFVHDFVVTFCSGFKAILPSKSIFLFEQVFSYIVEKEKVSIIFGTNSLIESIYFKKSSFLKLVQIGGEKLKQDSYKKLKEKLGTECYLINMYGTTETTIVSSFNQLIRENEKIISLGRPMENEKFHILNEYLKPVPIGAIGELYIGGAGLARGYLNKPELTKEKFIPNPFQTEVEKKQNKYNRVYKTGDLVRWLPDGNLDYIGRNDFQVKIRGFRIELEEIESVLLQYDGIKQCVVLAKERKKLNSNETHKYLVGYYVSYQKLDENMIMKYLKQKLTDYMVPSLLIHLTKLPITINGKLDMKALPDRDINIDQNFKEPRNEVEKSIQLIFSDILGIESNKISIQDDFFLLGGDSIVSIQLASKIREKLGFIISIKDIFKYKTIENIYDSVIMDQTHNLNTKKLIKSEQGLLIGNFDLLPIQKWFFNLDNFNDIKNHWNLSFMIKIKTIDIEKLKSSMYKLIEHHDSFRIKFKKDSINNSYYQYYDDINNCIEQPKLLNIENIKDDDELTNILTDWQSNFNIENGPLYAYGYIDGYDDGSSRLWFSLHHLIIDTVSWRILLEDLKKLYHNESLSPKGTSYRQWIETINNYKDDSNEKDYWLNILNDMKKNTNQSLKFDMNVKNVETFNLDELLTEKLLRECNKSFNTNINDILLTALGYALKEITKMNKNYILLEGHGREESIDDTIDLSRTMGWFTSMYPVCLYNIDNDISKSIIANKENLRKIPNKGVLFGKYFGYDDMPKVTFNYLGQFDNKFYSKEWINVKENSGKNHIISDFFNFSTITCYIIDSCFNFEIESFYDREIIINLKNHFHKFIDNILNSCSSFLFNNYNFHHSILSLYSSTYRNSKFYFEPFVIFNEHISENVFLFVFPPGGGGAESYFNNIAITLKSTKLCLFNNIVNSLQALKSNNWLSKTTIKDIARFYIQFIKNLQPKGPYNFFGWSFGGILALEISRILQTEFGEKCSFIFMIDSCIKIRDQIKSNIDTFEIFDLITYENKLITFNSSIILFKASKVSEKREEFREYVNTKANNLDKIIDINQIKIISMEDDDHDSWVKNKEQIEIICKYIENTINQ